MANSSEFRAARNQLTTANSFFNRTGLPDSL
jgi:hypothetical protein